LDNFIIGFMDQTSAQNLPNSARVLVYTKDKSKIIKNPRKYRVNTVGFQAINGNSLLKFIDNSKIVSMIQYIADIRIVNMKNQKIKETLYKTVYNSNLDEEHIIQQITDEKKISDEEFKEKINKRINNNKLTEKQLIHGIELDINKIKPKSDEIKHETEDQIIDNLEKSGVEDWLKKEKPIAMVLDNYTTHQSNKFKRACEIMNVTLIYLPYYSPHLNPIEQIWKSIKRIVSTTYIEDIEHLKLIFQIEFYENAKKESFYENWLDEYIINN